LAQYADSGHIRALYSDPSPYRQLQLIQYLKANARIAFFVDSNSGYQRQEIEQGAHELGLSPPVFIPYDGQVTTLLRQPQLLDCDFVLSSYNPDIFNSVSLKTIIFTLLRRNQGLIGYSSAWVKSGALATTFSAQENIMLSLRDMLEEQSEQASKQLKSRYPTRYDIKLNTKVLRSLGFKDSSVSLIKLILDESAKKGRFEGHIDG
jgi:hypothetical protein